MSKAPLLPEQFDGLTGQALIDELIKFASLTMPVNTAYIIVGSTGCSCCSNENFAEGPYFDPDDAERSINHYRSYKRLASQYADRGHWRILEYKNARIYGDKILIEDHIFDMDRSTIENDPSFYNGEVILRA